MPPLPPGPEPGEACPAEPGLPPVITSPMQEPAPPPLWPDPPAATQKAPKFVALLLVPMVVGMLPPGVTGTLFFLA